MAHGYVCVHCGRQETPHTATNQDAEGLEKVLKGYEVSLLECATSKKLGFTYSKFDLRAMKRLGLDPDLGRKVKVQSGSQKPGADSY